MHAIRTLTALSLALLATACAGPGTMNAMPASTGMAPMSMAAPGSMAARCTRRWLRPHPPNARP